MPKKEKPPRRQLSYLDAQDQVIKLNSVYRVQAFADRNNNPMASTHQKLDDVVTGEPDEELEDAELSDWERDSAIARERMRREGMT